MKEYFMALSLLQSTISATQITEMQGSFLDEKNHSKEHY
jgi:hypothetical protein